MRLSAELVKGFEAAKQREYEFFCRNGFPAYETADENGKTHPAHAAWVEMVELNSGFSQFVKSPAARQMFVLGWLKAKSTGEKKDG